MKLLNSQQMRDLDKITIEKYGICGIVLMENASRKVFEVIAEVMLQKGSCESKKVKNEKSAKVIEKLVLAEEYKELQNKKSVIICGKGNNGGDGFAVARHLLNAGCLVEIFLLSTKDTISGDAKTNLHICEKLGIRIIEISQSSNFKILQSSISTADFIIDAILGTGAKGELSTFLLEIIEIINASGKLIFSIDIPSGLNSDDGIVLGNAVKANYTITLGEPKIGLFVQPGNSYSGKIYVADIGIPKKCLNEIDSEIKTFLITPNKIRNVLRVREDNSHKSNYGKLLIVGGSVGMSGAPALAAKSALRTGTGLVYVGIPKSLNSTLSVNVVEAIFLDLPENTDGILSLNAIDIIIDFAAKVDAMIIGPGIRITEEIKQLVKNIISSVEIPIVLDADGLNAISDTPEILLDKKNELIITPHTGEMSRLLRCSYRQINENRLNSAKDFAKKFGVIVVLKGSKTIISSPDGTTYINPTGNPGMATAGSGDVLVGMIGSLVAQTKVSNSKVQIADYGSQIKKEDQLPITIFEAAIGGVYLHGVAGDIAKTKKGEYSLIASDIIEYIPEALKKQGKG